MADNTIPPKGDDKVGTTIFKMVEEVLKDKEDLGLHARWNRNYELKRGKHWKQKSSLKVPLITTNLLYTHRQRMINLLTDNNPTFDVVGVGEVSPDQEEKFQNIQYVAEHWWGEQEQQDVLESSVANGEDYGIAIEKVIFNPELGVDGDVETIVVDPFNFGWYPVKLRSLRDLQSCSALFHFYPITVAEAKRRWPSFASKFKADEDLIKEMGDDRRELSQSEWSSGGSGFITTLSSVSYKVLNMVRGGSKDVGGDYMTVVECWSRDYTRDSNNNFIYPGNIRYTVTAHGGKLVMEDRPNPNINPNLGDDLARNTYLYSRYPFYAANSVKDTVNAWGVSDYEQLEALNVELDKAISQLVLMKDRASRPKIINPKTSGVENREFTNIPGVINPVNSIESNSIRYLDYPAIPADIQNSINLFKDMFFLISGTFDLEQAQTPGREVIAYKAIAALLERASTMMRGKIRSYSRLIRERGRMYISMVQNFYTEERWITTRDKLGNRTIRPILGRDLIIPANLTVVIGSTMPSSRIQQREEAIELFRLGVIDREDLLEKLDWSSGSEVVRRMQLGPLNMIITRLIEAGASPQLVEYIKTISNISDKEFNNMSKTGSIPPVPTGSEAGQLPPSVQMDIMKANAEAQRLLADAQRLSSDSERLEAEKALFMEKVLSERVEQQVKLAGIQYDDEFLKIQRAKIVADIKKDILDRDAGDEKPSSSPRNARKYRELGARSNNMED